MQYRQRRRIFRLVTVVSATLIALIVSELYLRAKHGVILSEEPGVFGLPLDENPHRKSKVPGLIWEMMPGAMGKFQGVMYALNSHGFRSPEIKIEKPAHTRRVALLGDSITFGASVEQDKIFATLLQKELQSSLGFHVEMINAGVSGYNAQQIVTDFFHRVVKFEPDLVVMNFFADDVFPAYLLEKPKVEVKLRHKSLLYRSLWVYFANYHNKGLKIDPWHNDDAERSNMIAMQYYAGLVQYCHDHGHALMFVLHSEIKEGWKDHLITDMESWLNERNVPYLVAGDIYEANKTKDVGEFSINPEMNDPHPTAKGHQLLGEGLADFIIENHLLK